jgi:hypothetical protein
MTRPRIRPADHASGIIASYAFDVNLDTGLSDHDLQDLADLLRNHANARQLHSILSELQDLWHQQGAI